MANRKAKGEEKVELNMTPMIDVTFQLLIFFIVTMKFRLLEKKLLSHLPTDFGLNNSTDIVEENFVTVKLKQRRDRPGKRLAEQSTQYYIESQEIEGRTKTEIYQKILTQITSFRTQMKDAKGKIDAGRGVPHQEVVSVLDLFHKANFESITFVGLSTTKNVIDGENWFNKLRTELRAPVQ
ncbi:MAG: biopolymer transporter ExbD [Planctomycetes bacterium]|nr:biopolymer transporter ExbD [Planctomycetota bacterium]